VHVHVRTCVFVSFYKLVFRPLCIFCWFGHPGILLPIHAHSVYRFESTSYSAITCITCISDGDWYLRVNYVSSLPVSGCGSSPAGEGGRPLSLLPLPVSGLGSSPAGEGGRPISLMLAFSAQSHVVLMPRRTSVFRSMPIRFRTLSWELAEIMLLPLPVSGCGSSPAGEGGRPLSPSLYSLPLPVSGLGSSPAGEGGRPIHVTCQFMLRTTHILS